jgi:serine phosphatase RsbU (regulator of sigma subunit)/anti-sigma regulatory factor (Ser/Thr protein kinase)
MHIDRDRAEAGAERESPAASSALSGPLAAVGAGLCRWDYQSGKVELDAEAARLIGLAPQSRLVRSSVVRACFHPEDFVELGAVISLSFSEQSVAEALLRVVADDGRVLRVVRARLRPFGTACPEEAVGTLHEEPRFSDGPSRGVPEPTLAPPGKDEWRRSREAFLLDAGRALAEADSTSSVLRVAASLSMPGFTPDGLAVWGVQGDQLHVIGHHGQGAKDEKPFDSMPLRTDYPAAVVVRTGRAIYLPTREAYAQRFPGTWPLAAPFGRNAWAFLPLVVAGRTIGAWMAGFMEPVAFTPDERAVLTTIARMLAQALERARVHESERALTDGLQRSMLPERAPEIPGMTLCARYVPTGGGLQVGGDWYDVVSLPNGRTAIVIGDVQGHDVHAAGVMGQLRIALRAYAAEGHRPDAVLARASRFLAGLETDRFATCLYLEVEPVKGTLDIARAGHLNPGIRLGDGTCVVRAVPGGLPLGVDPGEDYPVTQLMLDPGEVLVLCTDGLIETGGHDLDSGRDRLHGVLSATPADDLEELADAMINVVHGPASHHVQGPLADRREDDIALLLLRRDPDGTNGAPPARRTMLTISQAETDRIAAARADVRATLHNWAVPELVESAELLVSELLTNVLVHTDCDALLVAELTGPEGSRRLRVEVSDQSDALPHRRNPGELASSGRGLLLMDALADAWGVEPRGQGKSTWFELTEPR